MPYTVPNQKTITIHRDPLGGSFLGINNDNWKSAARVLGAQAFLLYIYLASNRDGFNLALSPKAIQQEIGMPPSTYRDQLRKLESLGYLVPGKGNVYHFYEKPVHDTRSQSTEGALNSSGTAGVQPSTAHVYETTPENIEIYINTKEEINRPEEMNNKVAQISEREYLKRQFDAQW